MSLREWFEGAITGQDLTGDCQACQEKAEKYLDEILSQAALIRRLDASLDRWREACAENKRRARKWKRRAEAWEASRDRNRRLWHAATDERYQAIRERDEARAEAERLQARITEINTDRPAQIARLMSERDEARAAYERADNAGVAWLRHYNEAQEANEPLRKELDETKARLERLRDDCNRVCRERDSAQMKHKEDAAQIVSQMHDLDAEKVITGNYGAQVQELHDRLDTMTARARGMREECMRQSEDERHAGGYRVAANLVRIAGEPIP